MAKIKTIRERTSEGVIHLSNLCTEILEVTSSGKKVNVTANSVETLGAEGLVKENIRITGYDLDKDSMTAIQGMETAVCNLGSINAGRGYVLKNKAERAVDRINFDKLHKNVKIALKFLDRVIDRNFYPIQEAASSNQRWRPVGLGVMGIADLLFQLRLPYESDEAIEVSARFQEEIYYQALKTSCDLAKVHGPHPDFRLTKAAQGILQFDMVGVTPTNVERWDALKEDIKKYGLRNSLLIAIAPTATISHICGSEECTEPVKSNLLKRETLSGEFVSINKYLVDDLKKIGRWDDAVINQLKLDEGSIKNIPNLPEEFYDLYKTVWEISQKKVIAHARARGAFIDQSQSVNLFTDLNKFPADKRIQVLSAIYMLAWESELKTTYYFRSRSASRIQQVTVDQSTATVSMASENPEICDSCT